MKPYCLFLVGMLIIIPWSGHGIVITNVAGSSVCGYLDGVGTDTQFQRPNGITVDENGVMYVCDTFNSAVRSIAPPATNTTGISTNYIVDTYYKGSNYAILNDPIGIAYIGHAVFVGDTGNNLIRIVSPSYGITPVAGVFALNGSSDGTNQQALFSQPQGIAVDAQTNLYVSDTMNHTIRRITQYGRDWVTTTIGGVAGQPGSADGTNSQSRFYWPHGIAVDKVGDVYVTDGQYTIRKISFSGTNSVITTIAGKFGIAGTVDGIGSTARFSSPSGIAIDSKGVVYVADHSALRRIVPSGTNWAVSTVTTSPFSVSTPIALAIDRARGRLYFSDGCKIDIAFLDVGLMPPTSLHVDPNAQ